MTDQLFDRYKDALRAGHVAVLRGQLDDALAAYRRAADVAPTRALPHTSIGGVLLDLGRLDEALEELRIALELAPGDEGALLGRAEALARAGRPAEAAATLDTLADSQLDTGRNADAVETLQRALGLEERTGRRRKYQRAVRQLRMQRGERLPDDFAGRALPTLERADDARVDVAVAGEEPSVEAGAEAEPSLEAATEVREEPGEPEPIEPEPIEPEPIETEATESQPQEPEAAEPGPEPGPEPEAAEVAVEPESEPETEPVEEAAPDPRIVGEGLVAEAEAARARGDRDAALAGYLGAVRVFEDAGLIVAAFDACREALAIAPGDIDTHLRYAALCRARGWRELAQGRLVNVLRLADLEEDAEARARIRALIETSFADDEELMRLSA